MAIQSNLYKTIPPIPTEKVKEIRYTFTNETNA